MTNTQAKKQIVTIGGGTGTFTVLSGLRTYNDIYLTAIVSSADDGGSTGRLRDAYGILPPGDARQAIVALAQKDMTLRKLFAYRFLKGDVAGHTFGNLFLTALTDILGSGTDAIEEASRILRVNGRVLSASDNPSELIARLLNGEILVGEHSIDNRVRGRSSITELSLEGKEIASQPVCDAILNADMIILGPGDLYTSTIAALLPTGIRTDITKSKAKLVYIMNLFTKMGQTNEYTASYHVQELEKYTGRAIDTIIVNNGDFPKEALVKYASEGESPVKDDLDMSSKVLRHNLTSVTLVKPIPEDPTTRSLIRHDSTKLAVILRTLI